MPNITTNHAITYTNNTAGKITFSSFCFMKWAKLLAHDWSSGRLATAHSIEKLFFCNSGVSFRGSSIFSSRLCPLLENFSPVVRTFFVFLFSLVFLSSSINSSSLSTKREVIAAENFNQQQILAITSLLSNFKPIGIK